jgi:hypothetical protein
VNFSVDKAKGKIIGTFEFVVFGNYLERIFGLMYYNAREPNQTWIFALNNCERLDQCCGGRTMFPP